MSKRIIFFGAFGALFLSAAASASKTGVRVHFSRGHRWKVFSDPSFSYGDGAQTMAPGRYANATTRRIPRNVISRGHLCTDTDTYRQDAKRLNLPIHGAMQPLSIPDFLIRFLTDPDDLVIDPFGGSCTTGMAPAPWPALDHCRTGTRLPARVRRAFPSVPPIPHAAGPRTMAGGGINFASFDRTNSQEIS